MGIETLLESCMHLRGLVTAPFGSSEPFSMEKWACHVGAIPT